MRVADLRPHGLSRLVLRFEDQQLRPPATQTTGTQLTSPCQDVSKGKGELMASKGMGQEKKDRRLQQLSINQQTGCLGGCFERFKVCVVVSRAF